jgi:hypothetical protein
MQKDHTDPDPAMTDYTICLGTTRNQMGKVRSINAYGQDFGGTL